MQWVSCNQKITNLPTTRLAATHALSWNRLSSKMIAQLELVSIPSSIYLAESVSKASE